MAAAQSRPASRLPATNHKPLIINRQPPTTLFGRDVMPILTRAGCNMGACHGANAGKGGFHLSLLGYDPESDYLALTRFVGARRISPSQPDNSLMLHKATGQMPHGGGRRFETASPEYRVLRDWIAGGARPPILEGSNAEPRVAHLNVTPAQRTIPVGGQQHFRVEAVFTDGMKRDVTDQTLFSSGDGAILKVTQDGTARVVGAGEGAVVIRYSGVFTIARVVAPFAPARTPLPASNPIDSALNSKAAALGLALAPRCGDGDFLRRASLDVTGRLPNLETTRAFLADSDTRKREKLVDRLLASPEYVDFWTLKWGDLLRNSRRALGKNGMAAFHKWIRKSVAENKAWDKMTREILTAQGSVLENGAANFFRTGLESENDLILPPEDVGETVAQTYLGVRLQCARCHNHPFEKWTQNQFYQLAGYFGRIQAVSGKAESEKLISSRTWGEVLHPRTGAVMRPAALDGPALPTDFKGDRRQSLADWITASDNPFFAPVIVNRIWKHYMGRGLVEPVDDFRVTNPAVNEPLLAYLASDLRDHHYDLKHLMRDILCSEAYGRQSQTQPANERDTRYYTHFLVKRLSAEQLLDALDDVTGETETFEGYPAGTHAVQLMDTGVGSFFLDAFGRPPRQTTCECERGSEIGVTQTLHLLNNPMVQAKLTSQTGRAAALAKAKIEPGAIVDELFLSALSRLPTAPERTRSTAWITSAPNREQAVQDLLWAILNTREFVFNH